MSEDDVRRQWADALTLFELAQRAAERAPGTIDTRMKHLRHFSGTIGTSPWQVTYEGIRGWLDRCTESGWSRPTMLAHRSTIRAFYRWAHQSGRVYDDPAAEPSRRHLRLPLPKSWAAELAAFRSYLRGTGKLEATIQTRINAVQRFARQNPSLDPWAVTMDDLVDWMAGKRWAAETRKLHRDAFRSFFAWAVDAGRIPVSPAAKIPPVRGKGPNPRPVTEDVYQAALARGGSRERLALRLAAELGLRRGEVAQVHSRDIVGERGAWSLVVHGKGGRERILPLPDALATRLRDLPEGWAFPGGYNGHLDPQWLGHIISELLPAGVSMHALRHRFATRAYGVDRDVFTVQQLLGHSSPATTQRYVAVPDADKRRLVEAIASGTSTAIERSAW